MAATNYCFQMCAEFMRLTGVNLVDSLQEMLCRYGASLVFDMLHGLRTVMLIWSVFRPYRHTTYVDAAYCYSSVVCRSVCHSREPCKKRLGR